MLLPDVILSFPHESPHCLQQVENTKNQRSIWKHCCQALPFCLAIIRQKTQGPSVPWPKKASFGMTSIKYSFNARVMQSIDSEVTIRHPTGKPPAALWVKSINTLQSYRSMPPEALSFSNLVLRTVDGYNFLVDQFSFFRLPDGTEGPLASSK